MSSILYGALVDLTQAIKADSIALGYIKNDAGEFSFQAPGNLITEIEKHFDLNLVDELSFFSPSGKSGELFEIPVSAKDATTDRLYLTSLGDASTPAHRVAATTIARKVRGKKVTVYSACAVNKRDVREHAISLTMGA